MAFPRRPQAGTAWAPAQRRPVAPRQHRRAKGDGADGRGWRRPPPEAIATRGRRPALICTAPISCCIFVATACWGDCWCALIRSLTARSWAPSLMSLASSPTRIGAAPAWWLGLGSKCSRTCNGLEPCSLEDKASDAVLLEPKSVQLRKLGRRAEALDSLDRLQALIEGRLQGV